MKRRVQLGGLTSDVMRGRARFLALTVSVIKREHVHKYECIEFEAARNTRCFVPV